MHIIVWLLTKGYIIHDDISHVDTHTHTHSNYVHIFLPVRTGYGKMNQMILDARECVRNCEFSNGIQVNVGMRSKMTVKLWRTKEFAFG